MRMIALAVTCSCLTATGAFAQQTISCDQIAGIASTAPDFKAFRGKYLGDSGEDGGKTWRAKSPLSGGKCLIYAGSGDYPPEFSCTWEGKSKAEVARRYSALLGTVKACKQWHVAQQIPSSDGPDGQGNRIVGIVLLTDHHKYGFKLQQELMAQGASDTVLNVFSGKDYDELNGPGQ
jgi:hypothetical protein